MAATLREDNVDEDPELSGWIVRMRASGLLTELSLSPLEAADTAQLAEAISGQRLPETDAELLHAATGRLPAVHHRGHPRHRGGRRHAAAGW